MIEYIEAANEKFLNLIEKGLPLTPDEAKFFEELAGACEDFLSNYIYYNSKNENE